MKSQPIITIALILAFVWSSPTANAQMTEGGNTLYGNEWINYDQQYFKMPVVQDGIYRVSYQQLEAAGAFGQSGLNGSNLKVFRNGKEVPVFTSTQGSFGASDYIEFYGQMNRGELDKYLYRNPDDEQLNPRYSLFSDTAAYYLTWSNDPGERIAQVANDLSNLPAAETSCTALVINDYNGTRINGKNYGASDAWSCRYDVGEGWSDAPRATSNITLATPSLAATGGTAKISLHLLGTSGQHTFNMTINGNSLGSDNFSGWEVKDYSFDFPAANLMAGNNTLKIEAANNEDDRFALAYTILEYPNNFKFQNKSEYSFKVAGGDRKYLVIENFNHGGSAPLLYDLTNNTRIQTQLDGNLVKVVLPPSNEARELVLVANTALKNTGTIQKKQFVNYFQTTTEANYIILTHPSLLNDGQGNNYVQQYADYRASIAGGSFKTVIIDVTQVYDQFGYGIDRSELSIRNFLKLSTIKWQPEHLFMVGKGWGHQAVRKRLAEEGTWKSSNFVPTFGYPSSDYLLVTDNDNTLPWMAVGRLGILYPDQLRAYLKKVQEYESALDNKNQTIEDLSWTKKVMHFGGGDAAIQNTVQSELNRLKTIAQKDKLGANVLSYFKNSTDVIQSAQSEDVVREINEGANLLSFFGHSAPTTMDFNIGQPEDYNNKGKYPIFYAIGCNTNSMFEGTVSLSESFVLTEDKGFIAFFGATWITNLSNLSGYATYFYQNYGNNQYGNRLGSIIKQTINDYSDSNSFLAEQLRQVLMLHGDPALKTHSFDTPDYIVDTKKTFTNPLAVNTEEDSLGLTLTIANIGRSIADSLGVKLEILSPSGQLYPVRNITVYAPKFESTWTFNVPLLSKELGQNKLVITLDDTNSITEMPAAAEANNRAEVVFYTIANDIFPITPTEFSIVGSYEDMVLKASTANTFSEPHTYYMEIDTTELFNSPLLRTHVANQPGGIMEWQPTIQLIDSTVYYWRVSIDSTETSGAGFKWHNSSFVYIQNSPKGWNQSHYWQYKKDELIHLTLDEDSQKQQFGLSQRNVQVNNGAFFVPSIVSWTDVNAFVDGFRELQFWPNCAGYPIELIHVSIFKQGTLQTVINTPTSGNTVPNCTGGNTKRFIFNPKIAAHRAQLIDFLENTIEDGDYVAFFTTQLQNQNYGADQWAADSLTLGTNIFEVLEKQGARQIRSVVNNQTPYILFYQKNSTNFPAYEAHASTMSQVININADIIGVAPNATITSPLIGPASNWESLIWEVNEFSPETDTFSVDVIGVDANGNKSIIMQDTSELNLSLASIDANQFPYIQLVYNVKDNKNFTPTQLDYWRVLYTPVPEAALAPNKHLVMADTLQQGQPVALEFAVENISGVDMDSLLVHFVITDSANKQQNIAQRGAPLKKNQTQIVKLDVDTKDMIGGAQSIYIDVNPSNDQPELTHINNTGLLKFSIDKDIRNPLLDVTFDGIHIMDGDIVSPKPEIIATLRDDNQFLALNDTSLFRMTLVYPDKTTQQVFFDGNVLSFFPATGNLSAENKARVEYRPNFDQDGVYQLVIDAKDASGNKSGEAAYKVRFEVIKETMVSHVLNYPNPFSTSTQFVFRLTGEALPDYMKIQIMTVSGKIVREITMDELGPLRIGDNKSTYKWDGTDEFGEELANGVYLYRVITKSSDEQFKTYDRSDMSALNQYFKNGFGKLVILR
jgi:hypothetical protein